jgi:hypothetical protein
LTTTTALAAATLPTAPAAHLSAELLHLRLLVGSQKLIDCIALLLAGHGGISANLLHLRLLVGGQSQLGHHLLEALAALGSVGSAAVLALALVTIASPTGIGLGRRGLSDTVGVSRSRWSGGRGIRGTWGGCHRSGSRSCIRLRGCGDLGMRGT